MLRLPRERLQTASLRSRIGVALWLAAASFGCGGSGRAPSALAHEAGGTSSRIEERALSDRPPLSIIEREGDPEATLAFASLAADSAGLHAAFGDVLGQRLERAGFPTELVAHGLGFELVVLAGNAARARVAVQTLLQALVQPVTAAELANSAASNEADRTPPNAVAACSAELTSRRRVSDPAELERERISTFSRDRAAWAVVGDSAAASAVAQALAAGPDWPELGRVRSSLPEHSLTQTLRGERATLSVALTSASANRALGAASELGDSQGALSVRLAALGAGLRVRRVTATAHPSGACLRVDSDIDASPVPEARRLGFAIQLIEEEASLALARADDTNRLEESAVSAADPRVAARAAAYHALIEPATNVAAARLVALTTPDEAPLVPSIDAATEQARTAAPALESQLRVEVGQPGVWALVSTPCAASTERGDNAGYAALFYRAAAASATRQARLEPWVGAEGLGLSGFVERAPGESDAAAATRLGDALGYALTAPPSALEVAAARTELVKSAGTEPHPLLDGLIESLAPGHAGALIPRGTVTALQSASREAVLSRQRELWRLPHRLAVLSPTSPADAAQVTHSLARWLKTPDEPRPSPCATAVNAPVRGDMALLPGAETREGSYLAFRIPPTAGPEANVLADLLNQPGGALSRSLAEPDLAGAARALVFGTSSARAFVVQVSAFEGRDQEALARVQRLFERLASGGVLASAELEAALARQRAAQRLAALDPRFRLVQLLGSGAPTLADAAGVRRLAALLRADAAVIARAAPRVAPAASGKTPAKR